MAAKHVFSSPRKTLGHVSVKNLWGENFLIDKRGTFLCFQGLGLKTEIHVVPRVLEVKEHLGFDLQ